MTTAAAAETLPTCPICGAPIEPTESETSYFSARPTTAHASCFARLREQRKEQEHERRRKACERYALEQVSRIEGALPSNPHAFVGEPTFATKCRSARFRKFAAAYSRSGNALLLGPSGSGKTTAAIALVHRLIAEGIEAGAHWHEMNRERFDGPSGPLASPELSIASRVQWAKARDVVLARRAHSLGEGEPPLLAALIGASLAVIDEWSSEAQDAFGDLFAIVDTRTDDGLPTVVTSGLTRGDFVARYGDALFRRLTEPGLGQLIEAK